MSEGPTISSNDVLSLIQLKILAAIDCIRTVNNQGPNAEAIDKYISRTEVSHVSKTNIVNSIDELLKNNVVVNKKNN